MPDPKDKAQKAADDYLEDDYDNDWANYDYDNDPEGYYMHAGEFNYKLPTIGNSIIDSESTAVGSKDYKLYDAVLRRQKRVDDYWQYINEKEAKATLKRETRDEPSEWSKSKEKNRAEARLIGK